MEPTAVATTMTKEAFHSSKQYLALTARQQVWIDHLIATQDAAGATKAAYGNHTSEAYRAMLSSKLENSRRVLDALDFYFQRSERDKFVRDLRMDIESFSGIAKVQAQALLSRVLRLTESDESPSQKPSFAVGDVAIVDGEKRRVLTVDSNGSPTNVSDEVLS